MHTNAGCGIGDSRRLTTLEGFAWVGNLLGPRMSLSRSLPIQLQDDLLLFERWRYVIFGLLTAFST
jgi:hypothetical protein